MKSFNGLLPGVMAITLFLSACGGLPVDSGSGPGDKGVVPPVVDPVEPTAPPSTGYPSQTDDAVDQLLGEAMTLRDQGDVEGAISIAERALRIAPRNPRVYYVLGTLYLDKGEAGEALQLARKASSLDTEHFYRRSIDRLIADCEMALP